MNVADDKPTIGTAQAGEIFGVSKTTVSRWCREKKKFPNAYQREAGCPWHIPMTDIDALKKTMGIK